MLTYTAHQLTQNQLNYISNWSVWKHWLVRSLSAAARPLTFNWLEQDDKIDQQEKLRVGKRDESNLYL